MPAAFLKHVHPRVLGAVIDVQDFNGFSFNRVDNDVRKRCKREFSCAATMAGSASVRRRFEGTDTLVNRPHRWLGKVREMLLKVVLDAL